MALELALRGKLRTQLIHKIARWLWTIGCLLYFMHVVCAFQFFHDWSHRVAILHTAEQTAEVTGMRWGGGLYFNYAFTLLWGVDAVAWWLGDVAAHGRGKTYYWLLHGVFAFMVFNATVVFGPPVWKPIALVVGIGLAITYARSKASRESISPREPL